MKIVKTEKRKINYLIPLFVVIVIVNISVNLFVGSLNVKTTYEIQANKERIAELKEENSQLIIEIAQLEGKDRILDVATSEGLSRNEKNIIFAG